MLNGNEKSTFVSFCSFIYLILKHKVGCLPYLWNKKYSLAFQEMNAKSNQNEVINKHNGS